MLRWAFGYLAMAVVVAIGFTSLQGSDRGERSVASHAPERQSATKRSARHEAVDNNNDASEDNDDALEYVVEADRSGHFLIEAHINGTPITFLVDTGASDIVLTLDDARRLGMEPRTLSYTQRFATANGEVRGAPVILRELRIGQLRLFDVAASVNEAPLGVSLLGMDFLEQLGSYEVRRGRLVLRW
jgi:clan AA aspartic protease (TIGR02281 family)